MRYFPAIIAGLVILTILTRPFTIFFHEIGHALALLLLTKKGSTIYIGSYGDKKYTFKISVKKIDMWFRYNPYKWQGGYCIAKAENISLRNKFAFILFGPLFSLFFALFLLWLLTLFDFHNAFGLIGIFALASALLDFIINLIPRSIKLKDGVILYSDGYQLIHLKNKENFKKACELFNQKEYGEAGQLFQSLISKRYVNENIYRLAYLSFILCKDYGSTEPLLKKLEAAYGLNSDDCYQYAFIGFCEERGIDIDFYLKKSLALNPLNTDTLNAIGYRLNMENKFSEAIPYFDKLIEISPDNAYAFNNRGHAKIETGFAEQGLADINHSISLDGGNAYAFRNLGIYHLKMNNLHEARQLFIKAREMDASTDLIDAFINQTGE